MNIEKFTIKAQEAMQRAFSIAQENNQQAIENSHILKGILETNENISTFIFQKLSINVENVKNIIDKIIKTYPKVSSTRNYLSPKANEGLQKAMKTATEMKDEYISAEHIFMGIISVNDDTAKMLKDAGLSEQNLKKAILELRKGKNVNTQTADETYNSLKRFAVNLNEQALQGKLDPVIGRDEEIRRILQILSRRTKNNPILIGEPGVGKTAIAEGLARRIINADVPENLQSKQIYSLDMGALVAGAKYKGEFEERLKSVVKEVVESNGEIVLFIDEIHTLVGAGKGEGAMDAANILKPALARGELRAIGATTLNEYQKYMEKDKALERRFQKVLVNEPDNLSAIAILRGLKERYENHHKVRIKDEAIISAVELSQRYISDRFLPDKAIDLIDEAASKLKLEINSVPEEIDEIERKIMQIEIEKEAMLRENNKRRLKEIEKELAELRDKRNNSRAAWQKEKELINSIQNSKQNIENLKLEAEKAEREGNYGLVAEIRYGRLKEEENNIEKSKKLLDNEQNKNIMLKQEVDSEDIADIISKWTGIPISKMLQSEKQKLIRLEDKIGERVIGQAEAVEAVANAVRRSRAGLQDKKKPIGSFIFLGSTGVGKTELAKTLAEFLFDDENQMTRIDMSEYRERHSISRLIGAPPGYVGYDEGGQLTEAVRRKPYSVVLLDEIEKAHHEVYNVLLQVLDDGRLTDNKGRVVDFKNIIIIMTSNIGSQLIQERINNIDDNNRNETLNKTKDEVFEILKKSILPEFLNRIDEVIMFSPLTKQEIAQIVRLQFAILQKMLKENKIETTISENAINWLAEKSYDPQFGARPVKRKIQQYITNELSRQILQENVSSENTINIDIENDQLIFRR